MVVCDGGHCMRAKSDWVNKVGDVMLPNIDTGGGVAMLWCLIHGDYFLEEGI